MTQPAETLTSSPDSPAFPPSPPPPELSASEVEVTPDSAAALAESVAPSFPEPRVLAASIEAVLFSTDRPVPGVKLAAALGLIKDDEENPGDVAPASAEPGPAASPARPPADPVPTIPTDAPVAADSEVRSSEDPPVVVVTASAGSPAPPSTPAKPRKSRRKTAAESAALEARKRALEAVRQAVNLLNDDYEKTGRSFRIESLAGGYRVMTLAEFSPVIAAYQGSRSRTSLSPAAVEALAIISYKQPITRATLESIRGVACGEILRSLMERRLVTIVGRAEELGRPILYGTTRRFLEVFGLASLKDLPNVDELRSKS